MFSPKNSKFSIFKRAQCGGRCGGGAARRGVVFVQPYTSEALADGAPVPLKCRFKGEL